MPALLNARHELFAQEIANGKSITEAYIVAGYEDNAGNARRLRMDEKIANRIEAILSAREAFHAKSVEIAVTESGITMGKVLTELAKIGFANIADYVDLSGETPTWNLKNVDREKMAAVSELTTETTYERRESGKPTEVRKVRLKFCDKRASLVDIGKHLGMFRDQPPPGSDPSKPLYGKIEFVIVDPNPSDRDTEGLSSPPDECEV